MENSQNDYYFFQRSDWGYTRAVPCRAVPCSVSALCFSTIFCRGYFAYELRLGYLVQWGKDQTHTQQKQNDKAKTKPNGAKEVGGLE